MRMISWNVNGLRACMGKGWRDFFDRIDADIFALQETKLQPDQIELELPGSFSKPFHITFVFCSAKSESGNRQRGVPMRQQIKRRVERPAAQLL